MIPVLAFFGAFNPPTVAHIALAEEAMARTGREAVVFVPSRADYIRHAQGKDFAFSGQARLDMLAACAAARPWMRVCDWELYQRAQPRTYETLRYLRGAGMDAMLLVGSDKLKELQTVWRHTDKIAREFGFCCLTRGEDDVRAMIENDPFLRALNILVIETPPDTRGVSSTAARRLIAHGADDEALSAMLPREILPYIRREYPHEA